MTMTTQNGPGAAPAPVQDENENLKAEASLVAYRTGVRELGPYIYRLLKLEQRVAALEGELAVVRISKPAKP